MSEIRSQCEGCGACCRAIYVPYTHDQYETDKGRVSVIPDDSDLGFILRNWDPITKEEALQRNPHLQTWYDEMTEAGLDGDEQYSNNFYRCNNLDEESGRCKVHETRPRVCSGYPWYGNDPSQHHMFYAEDCFYKRDLQDAQKTENMQDSIHA